jgi:hypothetical protein
VTQIVGVRRLAIGPPESSGSAQQVLGETEDVAKANTLHSDKMTNKAACDWICEWVPSHPLQAEVLAASCLEDDTGVLTGGAREDCSRNDSALDFLDL